MVFSTALACVEEVVNVVVYVVGRQPQVYCPQRLGGVCGSIAGVLGQVIEAEVDRAQIGHSSHGCGLEMDRRS
jgi:hypothetical protein